MKNLLLIFTALLCVYLYVHPRVEPVPELQPIAAVAPPPVATPFPRPEPTATPEPKMYYHSALDAPAMGSGYTANGYFSSDPTAATGPHLSGSVYGNASGYSPYYYPYSTGTVYNTLIINNRSVAARVCPTPPDSDYAGRPRFVSPTGTSRAPASQAVSHPAVSSTATLTRAQP